MLGLILEGGLESFTILTLALIIGGAFAFAPLLYLVKIGLIHIFLVVGAALVSAFVTDTAWYLIGRFIPREKLYTLPIIRNKHTEAEALSTLYDTYGSWTVFGAKFVFGTRIAAQLLAGIHKMPYLVFLIATLSGTVMWALLIFVLVLIVSVSLSRVTDLITNIQVATLLLLLLIAGITIASKRTVLRRLVSRGTGSIK